MTNAEIPQQALSPRRPFVRQYAVALFAVVTLVLSAGLIVLLPALVAPMLVVFIPTLMAVLLIGLTDGWKQVGPQLFSAGVWRIGLKWALISLGAALALRGGTSLVALALGYPFQPQGFTPFLFVTLILAAGEEIGWRGYALPRALKRFNPLAAALLLGLPWALVHVPLTLPGKMLEGVPVIPLLLTMVSTSVLCAWVYLASGRSITAPVLLHGGQNILVFLNNGVPLAPVNWAMAAVFVTAAVLVALLTRGQLGLPRAEEAPR